MFVLTIFETEPFRPIMVVRNVFASEMACNTMGESMKGRYADPTQKSVSICLPERVFAESEPQVQQLERADVGE